MRASPGLPGSQPSGLAQSPSGIPGVQSHAHEPKQLKETGLEAITEVTTVFEGTVDFRSVEYKKDVFLGDICVTEYTGWGIGINGRLVEVIESMSETGEYSINPTFGL